MKKRLLSMLLLFVLVLSSACGGQTNEPDAPDEPNGPTVPEPTWETVVPDEEAEGNFMIATFERPVDEVNTDRGVHQLIYYTRMRGETTKTNEYGVEAVVVDGRVVSVGHNDSPIPELGFVVSGNDSHAQFILWEMLPGALVSFDRETYTLTVSMDKQAYLSGALHMLRECKDMLTRYRRDHPNPEAADALVANMEAFVAQIRGGADGAAIQESYQQILNMYEDVYLACMPSPEGEIRAVWHNLWGKQTKNQIRNYMERFASAGFNVVFLDVFAIGYLIFRSEHAPLMPQADVDFDVLQEYIDVGKELGIEIHACTNNFLIGVYGHEGASQSGAYLADWHPDFITHYKDGTYRSEIEEGGIMLNPAHPGARQLLLDIYAELVDNYDIGGINLDFIRYFPYNSVDDCMGFDDYSKAKVLEELGIDIMEITSIHSDEWLQFRDWRAEQVSSFVALVREMLDRKNREREKPVLLSACVVGRYQRAYNDRSSDWPRWIDEGWLDFVCPMSYFQYDKPIYDEVTAMLERVPGAVIAVGISPINMGLPRIQWLKQIQASRDAGGRGVALFSSVTLNARQERLFGEGPFRTKTAPRFDW